MRSFLVTIVLGFFLFGCVTTGDYGDIFKEEILPVLMEKGAGHARIQIAKLVGRGELTNEQAAKLLAIIDQLTKKDIAP